MYNNGIKPSSIFYILLIHKYLATGGFYESGGAGEVDGSKHLFTSGATAIAHQHVSTGQGSGSNRFVRFEFSCDGETVTGSTGRLGSSSTMNGRVLWELLLTGEGELVR
jgi:hypothetical protein